MSGGSAGPAGVKNLRAMFENRNSDKSTSPPSRGRSPSGSVSSVNSRPVSKVRASFVAVERPGDTGQPVQWGLRKTSDVSSMAEVREQAIMEDGGSAATQLVTNEGTTTSGTGEPSLGAILKGSAFEHAPTQPNHQPVVSAKTETPRSPKKTQEKPKMNGTSKATPVAANTQHTKQAASKTEPAAEKSTKTTKAPPANIDTKVAAAKSKGSPTLTKKSPVVQKKPQDSPTTVNGNGPAIKPRGGVSKILGVMNSANKAKEERVKAEKAKPDPEKKAAPKDVKPPSVASKPTAASKAHAQKQHQGADSAPVKSPSSTRPMKLPSAATATTAASAARKDGHAETDDSKKHSSDRRSTLPNAPRAANVTTKASLAKKSSRASLANGEDRSKSRQSVTHKPADESFIKRMTRPTAASAQRAHEKVQVVSPPRARQTSASQPAPKKSGRKSLTSTMRNAGSAKPTETSHEGVEAPILEHIGEQTASAPAAQTGDHMEDEGEPGPAEEEDIPTTQQAGAVNTMSA